MKTFFQRPDRVLKHHHGDSGFADLWVCTSLFNAPRFRSRWKLYQDFAWKVKNTEAKLAVVEVAFGERQFVIDPEEDPKPDLLVQLRTPYELWYKENALNVLVQHLPQAWQYLALVDADTHFVRYDWANECVQTLQHYPVVQMWTQMVDLNNDFEISSEIRSFIWNWQHGGIDVTVPPGYYYGWPPHRKGYPGAPGLAWAWRRDAWDAVGGLIDWGIVGAGDSYMAYGLIHALRAAVRRKFNPAYVVPMFQWEQHAHNYIKEEIGSMSGVMLHYWHGPKVARNYGQREQILVDTQFNPQTDLKRDWQGLYQLVVESERQKLLRDRLKEYFRHRHEDALS